MARSVLSLFLQAVSTFSALDLAKHQQASQQAAKSHGDLYYIRNRFGAPYANLLLPSTLLPQILYFSSSEICTRAIYYYHYVTAAPNAQASSASPVRTPSNE